MKQGFGVALSQEDVALAIKYWAAGIAICGLILGMDRLELLKPVRAMAEQRLTLVDRRVYEAKETMMRPVTAVIGIFGRQERIARLEEQLALAAVDQQKVKKLEAQIEFQQQSEYKASTLAEIYTKDELIVVGAGEINGILPGMAVTDKHGVLVGRIESVGRYVSRVESVGGINFKIPAQTISGSAKGMVYADGNTVVLGEVLQTEPLAVGDVIVTGGVESELPAGLIIGQVKEIRGSSADVTKEGVLDLLALEEGWVAVW